MARLALAALLLAGLVSPFTAAANAPTWTAQGIVTGLTNDAITVHGRTCRLAGAIGLRTVEFYFPGDGAKIACNKGVLKRIAIIPFPPIDVTGPSPSPVSPAAGVQVIATGLGTVTTSSIGSPTASLTMSGNFAITALGNGTITAMLGLIPETCAIGAGSPDMRSFEVGDRLSGMQCGGNPLVLTSLTPQ